jgi:hypothetical protein
MTSSVSRTLDSSDRGYGLHQVRNAAVDELTPILQRATAAIEPAYFRLSIHGGVPIYRERVYCYELYHQMRCLWPVGCPFLLNGEVDKAAHPMLARLGAAGFKPDLLVHCPGDMAGNHAVIEVKSDSAAWSGYEKDLNTLAVFRSSIGYRRAIYLVYGDERVGQVAERVTAGAAVLALDVPIELWLHTTAGEPADLAATLEPPAGKLRRPRRGQ